jgi:hypothetical protein
MGFYDRMSEPTGTSSNYSSYLPEVYAGHPNRIQRYYQYDDMDRDSDINAALDTIADFCTQSEEQNDEPFEIHYLDDSATETEIKILKSNMAKWVKTNEFRKRLWYTFRNCIKNGDAFFLRDPETFEWLWLDHYSVEMVRVDEEDGKKPIEYFIRGFDYNNGAKFAASKADMSQYRSANGGAAITTARPSSGGGSGAFGMAGAGRDPRQMRQNNNPSNELFAIDADHVVHLSLSVGMDINWPFGQSVLEPVFKTFKQKELLEDSVIIYRVQRAPERRVFYIDVGNMPPVKARAHIEQVKNEIHQRRIPNHSGGGNSMIDAAYNPLSINEDFYFAQSAEGRGSKVETLPGGDNLGEIGDMTAFTKKLARGLRIPQSYLPLGDDESGQGAYNDGKLGAAMIQEYRFNKYCMRLQTLLAPVFDFEFKKFLAESGEMVIDSNLYEIRFNPPQNFTKYRQIEVDQAQAAVYSQVAGIKILSERFKLKRFLNLTEEEILENETLWKQENAAKLKRATGSSPAESENDADLSSVGIRPMGDMGMDDMPMDEPDMEGGEMEGAPPADGGAPGAPPPGGAPAGPLG